MRKPKPKFTVILRYPDYYTDNWPTDCYTGVVEAVSWDQAAIKMQKELCRRINRGGAGHIEDPNDLDVSVVIEGEPKVWPYPCRTRGGAR
jgi:hypothetical protein